jgi:putative DNA primase/helicase
MNKPQNTARPSSLPPPTPELVRDALASIPPDMEREGWVRVGMAIKAAGFDDGTAQGLWDDWSRRGDGYKEADARDTWRSIKAGGAVTVATLFKLAKDHGWRVPAHLKPPKLSAAERAAQDQAKQDRQRAEAAELEARQAEGARRCRQAWEKALQQPPAAGCAYLTRKGVQAHGLRFRPGGEALVPMLDSAGELQCVQRLLPKRIKPKGDPGEGTDKVYGTGKAGDDDAVSYRKTGLFHLVGTVDGAEALLLAEGYATAASVHECAGLPVVVAFDAGNLPHVARALRALYPALPLLVCGDDDAETEARKGKNPGRIKATEAAEAAALPGAPAAAVFPVFAPGQAGKDFNDLASMAGAEAVRAQVRAAVDALRNGAPQAKAAPPRPERKPAGGDGAGSGDDGATRPEPDAYGFHVDGRGVWHSARGRDGERQRAQWVCGPLFVVARTYGEDGQGWGYALELIDADGKPRTWVMPARMLSGDRAQLEGTLRDLGLDVGTHAQARSSLANYIATRRTEDRLVCTDRVGWHGGVYVLPSGTIGQAEGLRYVFQADGPVEESYRQQGTLDAWRDQVAALAVGNSRLVFALCAAFAGPLLRFSGLESGGFNFRGDSRSGKSTGLLLAASVWGRPTYMQRWRTTDNGLEALAVQACDSLLVLDEFGQLDPRVAGDAAYMLANESAKVRATERALARRRKTWKLLFLSSGEVGLADQVAEAGKTLRAGQEVRMVDVPLDAGANMGGLEHLHEHEGPAQFSEAVVRNAARVYGVAGRAWLQWCVDEYPVLSTRIAEQLERHRDAMVPEAGAGQVRTVGSRFALLAAAGELATQAGITGWKPGEAAAGVRRCFEAWLAKRGHTGNAEEWKRLNMVRASLEKNGDALFTWLHRALDDHRPNTALRLGFKRLVNDDGDPLSHDAATEYVDSRAPEDKRERLLAHVEYLVLPEAFKREVCKGEDFEAVCKVLRDRGHLKHEPGRFTSRQRLPGISGSGTEDKHKVPVFVIKPSIFLDSLI